VQPGEDLRAGRWWWERPDQKECGLHDAQAPGAAGRPAETEEPAPLLVAAGAGETASGN